MNIENYFESFLGSEDDLRDKYGELSYYSKPSLVNRGESVTMLTPWAEYLGAPLVLPSLDFVEYVVITIVNAENRTETVVRYMSDVLKLLKTLYLVEVIEVPVKHVVVRLPEGNNVKETLHKLVEQLPEVGGKQ